MGAAGASSPPTNTVKISPLGSGINTMAFSIGSISITSGQTWSSFNMNGTSGTTLVLNCIAGKSNSSTPAAFFKLNSGDCGGTACYANSELPSALNFAFTGILTINGTNYNVVIGEGHDSAGHNNWWMSGTSFHSVKGISSNEYSLVTNDGLYNIMANYDYVHPGADAEANLFNVSVNPPGQSKVLRPN